MGIGKCYGQEVWVVEIIAYHFDAAGCKRLGSGFESITDEVTDTLIWMVKEGIDYRGALTVLMSR